MSKNLPNGKYIAAQQNVSYNVQKTHKRVRNQLKELYMFSFDEQYKKFEQLNDRTKQAYEFWVNAVVSTWEDFFKQKKK